MSMPSREMDLDVPGYTLMEELGSGGFSRVYAAYSEDSPEIVAVKVLRKGMDTHEILARFQAEQRLLRQLEHPGIVRLLDSGVTGDGRPFFVMDLVEGLPITDYAKANELSLRDRVLLFLPLCTALEHAHQRGVIHRDLKPSNLLVAEPPSGPQTKVIDFGIGKSLFTLGDGQTLVTMLGEVMGTPAYMAPEQAEGSDGTDTRSDVFSLGAVLYELVSGRPPLDMEAIKRLPPEDWSRYLQAIIPAPPSLTCAKDGTTRQSRQSLDLVILKALARNASERYQSTREFREDLGAWLEDLPVSAQPASFATQLRRITRTYRWQTLTAITTAGLIIVAAVAAVLLAVAQRQSAKNIAEQRDRAYHAEQKANERGEYAEHQSYAANIRLAQAYTNYGEHHLAKASLKQTDPKLRGIEFPLLTKCLPTPMQSLATGLESPSWLTVERGERFVAVAADSRVAMVDLAENRTVASFSTAGRVRRVAVSSQGLVAASYRSGNSSGERLTVWDWTGGMRELWSQEILTTASLDWWRDCLLVAQGKGNWKVQEQLQGRVALLEGRSGKEIRSVPIERGEHNKDHIAVAPDDSIVVLSTRSDQAVALQLPELNFLGLLLPDTNNDIRDVAFDAVGKRLFILQSASLNVFAMPDGFADTANRTYNAVMLPRTNAPADEKLTQLNRVNVEPKGGWVVTSENKAWHEHGEDHFVAKQATSLALSLSRSRYLAVDKDGLLELCEEPTPLAPCSINGTAPDIATEGRRFDFQPDGQRLFFQTWERQHLFTTSRQHGEAPLMLELSPGKTATEQRSWLPYCHPDGTVFVNHANSLTAVQDGRLRPVEIPPCSSAQASSDGTRLWVTTGDTLFQLAWPACKTLQQWPLPSTSTPHYLLPGATNQHAKVWGKDNLLRSATAGATELSAGYQLATHTRGSRPGPIELHLPSQTVAVEDAGVVRIFQLGAGAPTPVREIRLGGEITALAFSPEGDRLAVAAVPPSITLWDWKHGLELLQLPLRSRCECLKFSPDGKALAKVDFSPSLEVYGP
jgi:WD40 repeat protein/tRNA A-37 threonylcarbamoyl transferase component Bud32